MLPGGGGVGEGVYSMLPYLYYKPLPFLVDQIQIPVHICYKTTGGWHLIHSVCDREMSRWDASVGSVCKIDCFTRSSGSLEESFSQTVWLQKNKF